MNENKLRDELIVKLSSNVDTAVLQMVDTALISVLSDYEAAKRSTQLSTGVLRFPELEIYIAKIRFGNKTRSTTDQYSKFLGDILRYLGKPVDKIQDFDIMGFLNFYAETNGISDSTKNHKRLIANSFFTFLHKCGYIIGNPMATVDAIRYTAQVREALTQEEVERMRMACRENLRDNVVLELFLASGCRVSEVVGMRVENIDMKRKAVIILGKGKKGRPVFFFDRLLVYLEKYLDGRHKSPMVISVRAPYQGTEKDAVENIVREIPEKAEIKKRVFPRLLRYAFAIRALSEGMPLGSLNDLMGRACIETTRIYAKNHMSKVRYEYDMYASQKGVCFMGEAVMYDLYDEGRYVGRYPITALAVVLSIQYPRLIANYARERRTYCKRYQFERVNGPVGAELTKEWDKARQGLLRLGR